MPSKLILNEAVVLGLPQDRPECVEAKTNLEKTMRYVMGRTPDQLPAQTPIWAIASKVGLTLNITDEIFTQSVFITPTGESYRYGAGIKFYHPLIEVPYRNPPMGISPEDLADELPGYHLRGHMLSLFHALFFVEGREWGFGNIAVYRALLDPYIRMLNKYRREGVVHAKTLLNLFESNREHLMRRIAVPTEDDRPAMNACVELGQSYRAIADEFLNDVALKFYSSPYRLYYSS